MIIVANHRVLSCLLAPNTLRKDTLSDEVPVSDRECVSIGRLDGVLAKLARPPQATIGADS